ncbi:TonB-dependent receptor plug domain-containing protein [Thermodesulforhabdus norvegica]|uniref:Iron complex outermembrane recepter protein n=1 Tax=Thermodesulforhabdus norvegica TaxID=39841 RepID=A0A1I4TNI8_9BACT|nr:TonB-dependent receptor [Thermodesulforhabdus norvegica]SFM78195.1 iron complex outermembrane recepter protein [Thermodesulforhabdus norvegica]
MKIKIKNKNFVSRPVLLIALMFFLKISLSATPSVALDLTTLSLEELMNIEISSVTKRTQKVKDAPGAVYVITAEDIRRSGVTTVADLFRMVPGVHVAKIDAQAYAVSVRGFNDRFANKLLVLVDGRTVYNPLFSGVFWEYLDTILEDIERVEVIRGPGGSIWGANAVNGIINIITKKASDTQGLYASAAAGTKDREILSLRYGDSIGKDGAYRVYLKAREHDEGKKINGEKDVDDWREIMGGFRLDLRPSYGESIMFQGQVQHWKGDHLEITQNLAGPAFSCHICHSSTKVYDSVYFSGQWRRENSTGNAHQIRAFVQYEKSTGSAVMDWNNTVFDVEYQRELRWKERHWWTWGAGFRFYRTDTKGIHGYRLDPEANEWVILNAFLQDELALIPDKLTFVVGTKAEYHENVGIDLQPTGRLMWKINDKNRLWAAVSRAIRTPSRGELTGNTRVAFPGSRQSPEDIVLFKAYGNEDLDFEELLAFEAGYRSQFSERLTLDMAVFYNRYDNLSAVPEPENFTLTLDPVPHFEATTQIENIMNGEVYGLEVEANASLTDWWRLKAAYTFTKLFLHPEGEQNTLFWGEDFEKAWPSHILSLRSQWDLPANLELDLWMRYVSDLQAQDIPSYFTADLRLAWRPRPNLEVSLVGQNVFDPVHPEFGKCFVLPSPVGEVERSFFFRINWSF